MIGRTWFGSFLVCTISHHHSELYIKNPNKSAQPYKSSNTLKRQNQILSGWSERWRHFHVHDDTKVDFTVESVQQIERRGRCVRREYNSNTC